MNDTNALAHGKNCERLLLILADAPKGGLSMDAIQQITARTGEKWSLRTINDLLCSVAPQVAHAKVREGIRGKITKYWLRRN
jgi:hypothetical protein